MQWFQYKPGVAIESRRVVHRAVVTDDLKLSSWCGRSFHIKDVEPTSEPNTAPDPGEVVPGAPCLPCLLLVAAAVEPPAAIETHTSPDMSNRTLAGVMRKTQWMLDDAAYYVPEGRCSSEDCTLLAKTLEQLAVLVREQAARMVADE